MHLGYGTRQDHAPGEERDRERRRRGREALEGRRSIVTYGVTGQAKLQRKP